MRFFAIVFGLALAGCQTTSSPGPQALTPDEQRARAMCEDMVADDVRRQAGEMVINSCVQLRLREIKAGLK